MNLIILNGPTGTGKNTISRLVANKRERCAVVDFDVLRNMFYKPHLTPWDGKAGHRQNLLGVDHACMLAKSYLEHEYDVIILDVLTNETAHIYKDKLSTYNPQLIFLLPTYDEIIKRNMTRPPRLTNSELENVYKQQQTLTIYDRKIDNTDLSAEDIADQLLKLMR